MNIRPYPLEVREFVEQAIATGEYASENEVLVDAVRALRELKRRHQSLREDVQAGFAELDAGQGKPWDVNEMKRELHEQLKADRPTR